MCGPTGAGAALLPQIKTPEQSSGSAFLSLEVILFQWCK